MKAYIAANPKGAHGTHHYALDDFRLDHGQVDECFASYCERFALLLR
jgi:hypothetical protein